MLQPWEYGAILKLIIAAIFGGIIGFNREFSKESHGGAGLRTFTLVTTGSALFTIISQEILFYLSGDPIRIIAHVITGIGFIGAGVIWKDQSQLEGLSNAASIWIAAGIGMSIGLGLYVIGGASLIITMISLEIKEYIIKRRH